MVKWQTTFYDSQNQTVFNGSLCPDAPNDMIAALGKNGQFINVIPSQNMVWIRMGDAPDNSLVSFTLNNEIWKYINQLDCSLLHQSSLEKEPFKVFPNPATKRIQIQSPKNNLNTKYSLYNHLSQKLLTGSFSEEIHNLPVENFSKGVYFLTVSNGVKQQTLKIVKQ